MGSISTMGRTDQNDPPGVADSASHVDPGSSVGGLYPEIVNIVLVQSKSGRLKSPHCNVKRRLFVSEDGKTGVISC